jgi:hypothetical protein
LGFGVALRVARARRQAGKAEPAQDLAHAPLREPHAEAPLDHGAEVDPAPARVRGLLKRIRSREGMLAAKMDIRAPRSS